MIKNNKQLTARKKSIRKLEDSLKSYKKEIEMSEDNRDLKELYYDTLLGQYEEILAEIEEYETLMDKNLESLDIKNVIDLPRGLIKFRIAAGLTQKEFANKLMIKEQQIQRYEQDDYLKASFDRIVQIIDVLDIKISVTNKKREEAPKLIKPIWHKYSIPTMNERLTIDFMTNVRNNGLLAIKN